MNKRIRGLIAQCEHTTRHSYVVGDGTFEVHHFDKEKFAQLIVRECARIAYDEAVQAGRTNKRSNCLFGTMIGKRIENDFGVGL